jgi:hypothetical protein
VRTGGGFHRVGVGVPLRQISVGDGADVPAVEVVFLQPLPDFFFQLQPVPFGDALLDAADENGGGVDSLNAERLVGSENGDAFVSQFPFQFQGVVIVAGRALNVFAHHERERRFGGFRGPQQVSHAAVAGDAGAGGGLPVLPLAARLQVQAAGFDVPVPGHDLEPGREPGLGLADLPAQGRNRVLHQAGGPADERDRHRLGRPAWARHRRRGGHCCCLCSRAHARSLQIASACTASSSRAFGPVSM